MRPGPDAGDADVPGRAAGQGRALARGGGGLARHGLHLEARARCARQVRRQTGRAGRNQHARRAALARGEHEPARGGEIIGLEAPDLRHHGSQAPALQRLFGGPKAVGAARRLDDDEASRVDPMRGQARRIRLSRLRAHMILDDPDDRAAAPERGGEAGGKRQREAAGGRGIAGTLGDDLVQCAASQAAGQRRVERGFRTQGDAAGRLAPCRRGRHSAVALLDAGDGIAQKADFFRPVARRHRAAPRLCSLFVPYRFLDSGRESSGISTMVEQGVGGMARRLQNT